MKASQAQSYPFPVPEAVNEVSETLRNNAVGMCVRLRELVERVERLHCALHGPVDRKGDPEAPDPPPSMCLYLNKAGGYIDSIIREMDAIERRL